MQNIPDAIESYVPYPRPVEVPLVGSAVPGVHDSPVVCVQISALWLPYVVGAIKALTVDSTWKASDLALIPQATKAANELLDLIQNSDCSGGGVVQFRLSGDCTIQYSNDGGDSWFDMPSLDACYVKGVALTELSSGSTPTASVDSSRIIQLGIPTPLNGTNGADGANGLTPDFVEATATALAAGATPTAVITADLPSVGSTTIPLHLALGIPAGAAGAAGSSGVVSVANVDQDKSLPDTIVYDTGTHILTLKRPGAGYSPDPPSTASICDVSETIGNDVLGRITDFINAEIAAGLLYSNVGQIAGYVAGAIPVLGDIGAALLSGVFNAAGLTSADFNAAYTTDVKTAIKKDLYCVMETLATKKYTTSVQDGWSAAVLAEPSSVIPDSIRTIISDIIASLDPLKMAVIGSYAVVGSGSCGGYSCSSYDWDLFIDLRSGHSGVGILSPTDGSDLGSQGYGYTSGHNVMDMYVDWYGGDSTTIIEAYELAFVINSPGGAYVAAVINNGSYIYNDTSVTTSSGIQYSDHSGLSVNPYIASDAAGSLRILVGQSYANWNPPPDGRFSVVSIALHGHGTPPRLTP